MPGMWYRLQSSSSAHNGRDSLNAREKEGTMRKHWIALFVASIFAFSLGIAYAEEEHALNPWERLGQTSTKSEHRAKTKAVKTSKKEVRKTNAEKTKKTHIAKAEKTSMEKAPPKTDVEQTGNSGAAAAKEEKKEPAQKKKYIFW